MSKKLLTNLILFGVSFVFCLIVIELIFPHYLNKVPFKLYADLDREVWVFGQSSKASVIPKDYIALVGDSYAAGGGDWGLDELESNLFSTPDYHSAHILHRKLGVNVVTFGVGGAGSLRGMAEPIFSYEHVNSLRFLSLEKPRRILVYFYEGNDVYENIMDYYKFFEGTKYNPRMKKLFFTQEFFQGTFIPIFVMGKDSTRSIAYSRPTKGDFFNNFLFSRFLLRGLKNVLISLQLPKSENAVASADLINKISVAGKQISIPYKLQAPPFLENTWVEGIMGFKDSYIRIGIYVFEQSLTYLANFFKESAITVVYIPSPLSSYKIESDTVAISSYMGEAGNIAAEKIPMRSREVCRSIENIANFYGFNFVDTTKFIRRAASKELVHGPKDWDHFNKRGQEALSEAIITAISGKDSAYGCDDMQ